MKLRAALFLATAFLAAALALAVLPACSDDPGESQCAQKCDNCYVIGPGDSGEYYKCTCLDPVDDCGQLPDPPTNAECDAYCNNTCWTRGALGECVCDPCPEPEPEV